MDCVAKRTRLARRKSMGQLPADTVATQIGYEQIKWEAEEERRRKLHEEGEKVRSDRAAKEEEERERMEIEAASEDEEEGQERIVKASIEEGREIRGRMEREMEGDRENRNRIMKEMGAKEAPIYVMSGATEEIEMVDCTSSDSEEEEDDEEEIDLFKGINDCEMNDLADIDESQIQGMAEEVGEGMLGIEPEVAVAEVREVVKRKRGQWEADEGKRIEEGRRETIGQWKRTVVEEAVTGLLASKHANE